MSNPDYATKIEMMVGWCRSADSWNMPELVAMLRSQIASLAVPSKPAVADVVVVSSTAPVAVDKPVVAPTSVKPVKAEKPKRAPTEHNRFTAEVATLVKQELAGNAPPFAGFHMKVMGYLKQNKRTASVENVRDAMTYIASHPDHLSNNMMKKATINV